MPRNLASIQVVTKIGFQYEGALSKNANGKWHLGRSYALGIVKRVIEGRWVSRCVNHLFFVLYFETFAEFCYN